MLINSHFSINRPRPLMPGLINIAGAHVKPPKPLPEDIQVKTKKLIFFQSGLIK